MMPIRSIAIIIFSFVWLGVSIKQWAFDYPDLSSLLFAIGFFFVGLYVAYDQWYKKNVIEKEIKDIVDDIRAIIKNTNGLEESVRKMGKRKNG